MSEFIAVSSSRCMLAIVALQMLERGRAFANTCARAHCTQRTWPSTNRWTKSVVAGGCAGICYWLVAFPFDGNSYRPSQLMFPYHRVLDFFLSSRNVLQL